MHDRAAKETAPADQICTCKQLWHDVLDVICSDLVYQARDALAKRLPAHALKLSAARICALDLGHERSQTRGRNVRATSSRLGKLGKRGAQCLTLGFRLFLCLLRHGALALRAALVRRTGGRRGWHAHGRGDDPVAAD